MRQFLRAPAEGAQGQGQPKQSEESHASSSDKGQPGKAQTGTGSPTENYLRVVGERVAAMLDPLGRFLFCCCLSCLEVWAEGRRPNDNL